MSLKYHGSDGHRVIKGWFGVLSHWEEVWLPGSHQTGDVMGGDHMKIQRCSRGPTGRPLAPGLSGGGIRYGNENGFEKTQSYFPDSYPAPAMTIGANNHHMFHLMPLSLDCFIHR